MVSLGDGQPWRKELKAPVALALVLLAMAAWKGYNTTLQSEEYTRTGDGKKRGDNGNPSGNGEPVNGTAKGGKSSSRCRCDCHRGGKVCEGFDVTGGGVGVNASATTGEAGRVRARGRSNSRGEASMDSRSNGKHKHSGSDITSNISSKHNGTNNSNGSSTSNGNSKSTVGSHTKRCCNCAAAIAATAAATALGRRTANGSFARSAAAGTPRRGRNDRRSENNGGRRRRSRTREGSGNLAAVGGSGGGDLVATASAGGSRKGQTATGNAVPTAAEAAADEASRGATVISIVSLRRMCHFPAAVLRSGLVFERVVALSLPNQGLGDGDVPQTVARLAGTVRRVDMSGNRLTVIPSGLLRLGPTLKDLNLGNNEIAEMTAEIAKLNGLLFFNMAGNRLTRLPAEIGKLTALRRLGLKGNALVRLPASLGDLSHLVELYLTGNILEALPNEIVKLRRLKKLQLSFNNLRSLPHGMEGLRSLELCRLAVNPGLSIVPPGLAFAERLSWVSLAGSTWCARATDKRRRASFPVIQRDEVVLGESLGGGASGDVYAATYRGQAVAVKVFKSDIGPDGNSRDELDVACTVDHPNLTKALCIVRAKSSRKSGPISTPPLAQANADAEQPSADDTTGTAEAVPEDVVGDRGGIADKQWLVMERVAGEPLAEKPDFSSVLRCRWGSGRRFEPVLVLAVLLQVARAMSYLHEKGICHGDLYAHNVLVDGETGTAILCDFGASFFYPSEKHDHNSFALEGTEVRAFGLMARDMACRSSGCEWILQDLVPSCLQADTGQRPSFHEIINQLHAELMQSVEPSSPMVTSAKSLHSLLDRPDIAAERGRLLSAERRQEPSTRSEELPFTFGCSNASTTDGVTDGISAIRGRGDPMGSDGGGRGVSTYKRGRGGRGGRAGDREGHGENGRPIWRLGGVQEAPGDDEADEEAEESEKAVGAGGDAAGKSDAPASGE